MNTIHVFVVVFFIASANGAVVESKSLIDPWREVREICRKQCGLTKKDLVKAENNLQKVRTFIHCFAMRSGSLNEDGAINKEATLKNIAAVTPLVIAKPMLDCCIDRVYKGKRPKPHKVEVLLTEVVACWKNLLPHSMWNIFGILRSPVYHRLDKCQKRQW